MKKKVKFVKEKEPTVKKRLQMLEIRQTRQELMLAIDGELIRRLTDKVFKKKRNVGSGVKFKTGSRKSL